MNTLDIGFSTCPNDTFIFHAMLHDHIDIGNFSFAPHLYDVEELNKHEGRFIYPDYGCKKIIDLGEWWESETGMPIPLGCITIRKDQTTISQKTILNLL